MTPPKRIEEIKARLETDNIAVIERWDKVTGERIVYSHDLEQMHDDLTFLLALIDRQAKALEVADGAMEQIAAVDWKMNKYVLAARAEIAAILKEGMNIFYCQLYGQYTPTPLLQGFAQCPACAQSDSLGTGAGGMGGMPREPMLRMQFEGHEYVLKSALDAALDREDRLKRERDALQSKVDELEAKLQVANDTNLRTYDGLVEKADMYDQVRMERDLAQAELSARPPNEVYTALTARIAELELEIATQTFFDENAPLMQDLRVLELTEKVVELEHRLAKELKYNEAQVARTRELEAKLKSVLPCFCKQIK